MRRILTALLVVGLMGCVSLVGLATDAGDDASTIDAGGTADSSLGKAIGTACTQPSDCASGFCTDGVCCNTACNGQCEACEVAGAAGTCTTLPQGGLPHGLRAACTGNGAPPCGGSCDGVSPQCSHPSADVICGAACDGKCDGAGTCSSGSGACPGGFACGFGGCKTTCAGDNDCQTPLFKCDSGTSTCKRIPESDCLDGVDNNGDGLADCNDPTCTADVECEPDAATGTLGNLTNGACDANYGPAVSEHQNLSTPACPSTCGCSTTVGCNTSHTLYTSSNCSTGATTFNIGVEGACTDINPGIFNSSTSQKLPTVVNQSCTPNGASTMPDSTWGASKNFCAVTKKSSTCGAGKICVAKRASGSMCVQLPAGSACPGDYAATSGTYYTSYTKGTCSCGCTVTSATCSGWTQVLYYATPNCVGTIDGYNSQCGQACCTSLYYGGVKAFNAQVIASIRNYFGAGSGTCGATAAQATQSTPNGASLFCCK